MSSIRSKKQRLNSDDADLNGILHLIIHADWFSRHLFTFMCIRSISNFDTALTNYSLRTIWLNIPKHSCSDSVRLNTDENIDWCLNKSIQLSKLNMRSLFSFDKKGIADEKLIKLSKNCQALTHFTFLCPGFKNFTELTFSFFISQCCMLQKLQIFENYNITDKSLMAIGMNCPQLKFIDIMYKDQVTDNGFFNLLKGCKLLEYLKLSLHYDYHLIDFDVDTRQFNLLYYLGQFCPLLSSIWFDDVGLSDRLSDIDTFKNGCPLLKFIHIEGTSRVIPTDFYKHILSTNITAAVAVTIPVSITTTIGSSISSSVISSGYSNNGCCKLLETVKLTSNTLFTNDSIQILLKGCPLLKTIEIDIISLLVPTVTALAFDNIAVYCPLLQQIRLIRIKLNNRVLRELGSLKFLKEVYFSFNRDITDEGIAYLISEGGIQRMAEQSDDDDDDDDDDDVISSSNRNDDNDDVDNHDHIDDDHVDGNIISSNSSYNGSSSSSSSNSSSSSSSNSDNNNITSSSSSSNAISDDNNNTTNDDDGNTITNSVHNHHHHHHSHQLINHFSNLERISIKIDGYRITCLSIYLIAEFCPNLTYINIIDHYRLVSSPCIKYLINICKQLAVIEGNLICIPKLYDHKLSKRRRLLPHIFTEEQCNFYDKIYRH